MGKSVLSSIMLSSNIENIYDAISDVYTDYTDASLLSASQALVAAKRSTNPSSEIRSAVSHLRSAFNFCETALRRKVKRGISLLKVEMDFIYDYQKEDFYYKMAEVGGIISLIYEQMGEKENSIEWQEKSLKCIKKGVEYFNIETYELKSISSSYVQEVKVLSNDVVFGFLGKLGHPIGYTYETVISEEGEKFIEDSKKELIRKFSNNLKSMKFEI